MASGWELLQAGNYKAAIRTFKDEYRKYGAEGILTNIGISHLCVGDFLSAKKLFDELRTKPPIDSGTYALAGVSRWCLDEQDQAVALWQAGLDCQYVDEAGGLELPLLLYFAGARQPGLISVATAADLMKERLTSGWAKNWPGPPGRFLVGSLDERELRDQAAGEHELVTVRNCAQVEFYVGIKAWMSGHSSAFVKHMQLCASARLCELVTERYLARHELMQSEV